MPDDSEIIETVSTSANIDRLYRDASTNGEKKFLVCITSASPPSIFVKKSSLFEPKAYSSSFISSPKYS